MAGTATVTFFHHSGFSVAVKDILLVFDYWRGENGALPQAACIFKISLLLYKKGSHRTIMSAAAFFPCFDHFTVTLIFFQMPLAPIA